MTGAKQRHMTPESAMSKNRANDGWMRRVYLVDFEKGQMKVNCCVVMGSERSNSPEHKLCLPSSCL